MGQESVYKFGSHKSTEYRRFSFLFVQVVHSESLGKLRATRTRYYHPVLQSVSVDGHNFIWQRYDKKLGQIYHVFVLPILVNVLFTSVESVKVLCLRGLPTVVPSTRNFSQLCWNNKTNDYGVRKGIHRVSRVEGVTDHCSTIIKYVRSINLKFLPRFLEVEPPYTLWRGRTPHLKLRFTVREIWFPNK